MDLDLSSILSTGINAAISALDSATTIQLNLKYVQESVLTMHSAATAAEFGDGASFPLKVQTNYIDTFQGMSWQHVFCNYFKYNRVTVIASGDFFGRMATIENSDNTYCRITHLMVIPVNIGATDVPQVIADAKESGANIFLFLISAPYIQLAAEVLAAGYFDGVFGEGKQILGSEQMTKPVLFTALEGFGVDVPKLMKGYMAMVTDANYHLRRSAKGASFIERWRDQPATQWMEDSIVKCDQSTDSIEQNYLYRSGLSMFSNHTCLGLSFSAFKTDGSDMAKFLGNTYDATYALAYAFNGLIESNIEVNGINLHSAIVDDVDFIGVSGHIDVFEGDFNMFRVKRLINFYFIRNGYLQQLWTR